MAEELILNNFRTAYHMLDRNVVRTLRTQAGVDSQLSLQVVEASRFLHAVEQYEHIFPPEEYTVLTRNITTMVKFLNDARPAADPKADPEPTP
ncbi:hypothetical protein B0H11DRAFT_1980178, partial [Mycena galericulata]